ncbi:MAG: hypothetical protein AAFQ82_08100 [Myxococcota bacterium]
MYRLATLLIFLCACGSDPTIEIVSFPSDTTDTEGPYQVEVVPTPNDPDELASLELEVTFLPEESNAISDFDPVDGSSTWSALIAGRPAGTTVQFRVKLVESDGTLIREPTEEPLSFRILE